jgi:AcrR family transcriptional regulator
MATGTRPGRPAREHAQDACDGIVRSACLHFARHGIKGSSKRQIAADAKVTPAMIHYYFKKKEALHLAVLQSAFVPLMTELRQVTTLEAWVRAFHAHLLQRPWFPHLMLREVLPPNGELRGLFLRHCAPQVFGSVKSMVTKELKGRKLRTGFDIDRHVVLLLGMLIYPFLGMEIAQNVTGRKFDKVMFEGFRDDALALFRNGVGVA